MWMLFQTKLQEEEGGEKKKKRENLHTSSRMSHARKGPAERRSFIFVKTIFSLPKTINPSALQAIFSGLEFVLVLTVEDRLSMFTHHRAKSCCDRTSLYPQTEKTWQQPFRTEPLFKRNHLVLFVVVFLMRTDAAKEGASQSQYCYRQRGRNFTVISELHRHNGLRLSKPNETRVQIKGLESVLCNFLWAINALIQVCV